MTDDEIQGWILWAERTRSLLRDLDQELWFLIHTQKEVQEQDEQPETGEQIETCGQSHEMRRHRDEHATELRWYGSKGKEPDSDGVWRCRHLGDVVDPPWAWMTRDQAAIALFGDLTPKNSGKVDRLRDEGILEWVPRVVNYKGNARVPIAISKRSVAKVMAGDDS